MPNHKEKFSSIKELHFFNLKFKTCFHFQWILFKNTLLFSLWHELDKERIATIEIVKSLPKELKKAENKMYLMLSAQKITEKVFGEE